MESTVVISGMKPCSVGSELDEDCHKTTLIRKAGFLAVSDLTEEEKKLLKWRTGVPFSEERTICFHHEKFYISRYASQQKYCFDPFKLHKQRQIHSKF